MNHPTLVCLKQLGYGLLLLLFTSSLAIAQKAGENCADGKCDKGLHCVQARNPKTKSTEDFCCECTQSQLDAKTRVVTEKCKWFKGKKGQGWYPEKNPTYLKYVSDEDPEQDRVAVIAYDELLEGCKECEEAREDRDNACWDGGDDGHKDARQQVKNMNRSIGEMKRDAISDKEVYYCSKSSYEGAMRAYNSKCHSLRISNIERAMEKMDDEIDDEEEIDCDDLEDYIEQCEACYEAARDLISTAFKRSDSYAPSDIVRMRDDVENAQEFGEDLLKKAKKESLCD